MVKTEPLFLKRGPICQLDSVLLSSSSPLHIPIVTRHALNKSLIPSRTFALLRPQKLKFCNKYFYFLIIFF